MANQYQILIIKGRGNSVLFVTPQLLIKKI